MNAYNRHRAMLASVAEAIGNDLLKEVAFVGGCTTGLFLTDDFSREQVRHTDDVDLIVHVVGYLGWTELQDRLRERGFRDDMSNSGPICAMKLGELRVDFMPDDPKVLSFTNRWYADALKSAEDFELNNQISIRLVRPPYFVATKLEAYSARGDGDPLGSQDIEDILCLFDGRPGLVDELEQAPSDLRAYVAQQLGQLLDYPGFEYAVAAASCGNAEREDLIWDRLERIAHGEA